MAPHVIVGFVFYKNEGWVNAWRLGSKLKIFTKPYCWFNPPINRQKNKSIQVFLVADNLILKKEKT